MQNGQEQPQLAAGVVRVDVRDTAGRWADAARAAGDEERCRVVVLGGGFSENEGDGAQIDAVAAVAALTKPVIAAVAGPCHDWGLELALACDLRLADERATFAMRQPQHGTLPTNGGTQRLPRIVGRANALRLVLTGEVVDARTAQAMGLVQMVAPHGTLDALVGEVAAAIAAAAPLAVAYAKDAVGMARDLPLAQGLAAEHDLSVLLQSTRDRDEGLAAWREHRPPQFEGR